MLLLSMTSDFLKERFRLRVFFVRMWLAWDFEYLNLPVPVFLNRFAADLLVLIFGICKLLYG
jgi:hypothetical protein